MIGRSRLIHMPRNLEPASARARAEALFKPRQAQAPIATATAESKAPERVKSNRMHQLKTLRLPRVTPRHDG